MIPTTLLLGDSVMLQSWHHWPNNHSIEESTRPTRGGRCKRLLDSNATPSRVCIVQAGWGNDRLPDANAEVCRALAHSPSFCDATNTTARCRVGDFAFLNLGDALRCVILMGLVSTRRDTVIANVGLHHYATPTLLVDHVDSLARWSQTTPACVAWRETTPQHFDTPNGEWSGAHGGLTCCAPLRDRHDVQRYNRVTTPRVQAHGMVIVQAFALLAHRWRQHPGCDVAPSDCTHFDAASYHELNALTIHSMRHCSTTKRSFNVSIA